MLFCSPNPNDPHARAYWMRVLAAGRRTAQPAVLDVLAAILPRDEQAHIESAARLAAAGCRASAEVLRERAGYAGFSINE